MFVIAESIPCPFCDLVQVPGESGRCRRCGRSLGLALPADDASALEAEPVDEAMPTLPPPLPSSTGDGSEAPVYDALVYEGELELDLPVRPSYALATTDRPAQLARIAALGPSAPARRVITATVAATVASADRPVARHVTTHLESHASRSFVDPETGAVRTWVVALMLVVCIAATLVGRLFRMRAEIIERAMDEGSSSQGI